MKEDVMDEPLALCSTSLIQQLAGTTNQELARLLAARRIAETIRTLDHQHTQILTWRYGLDGDVADIATIARWLRLPDARVDELLGQALEELGWALICRDQPPWASEVAA
jgi:DNA-directed RNA polymerase sigma subunit (sigma70/sigma32)